MGSGRRCVLTAVVVLFLTGGLASVGTAQSTAPTLTGEVLFTPLDSPPSVSATCNPGGTSTVSFGAAGTAMGPYGPGTFAESGTITIGPQQPSIPLPIGQVTGFQASFTIVSPQGVVTGTKTLIEPPPLSRQGAFGMCSDLNVAVVTSQGVIEFSPGFVAYTAQITTATGQTCTDQGTSRVRLNKGPDVGPNFFDEEFRSSQLLATCACPPSDDNDNDGLIDARESLLGTRLGIADSDGDGINDGNDDANGNGEDDEDEDDEDDDGCPDVDSNENGIDDEDEDD